MKNIISIQDLSFSYNRKHKQFSNLNLDVPTGSIFGFLGPNGSGKSTLIRLILGLLNPASGSIKLMNLDLPKNKIRVLKEVGSLIENPSLYSHLSGYKNLCIANYYKGKLNKKHVNNILSVVGLSAVKHNKVKSYSLGMKQRLGIAMSLISDPKILVLDEPINGLDPKGIKEIRTLIKNVNKEFNTTIFISSHLLSEIENTCSNIAIINKGKLLYNGTIEQFKKLQNNHYDVSIETSKISKAIVLLKQFSPSISDDGVWIKVRFKSKDDISTALKILSDDTDLKVFQCKIQNDLEKMYLNLIGKNS